MPKFINQPLGDAAIAKAIKDGRGQGTGAEYRPWLETNNVPSIGRKHRITGWRHNRLHHFLSDGELKYYMLLEWEDDVLEIREQYPLLPYQQTVDIAASLGFKHPEHKGEVVVMTTDFYVVLRDGVSERVVARTFKPRAVLDAPKTPAQLNRVLEKLEIERRYWQQRGVDWGIVTDAQLPPDLVWNVSELRPHWHGHLVTALTRTEAQHLAHELTRELCQQGNTVTLGDFGPHCDHRFGLAHGTSLNVVWHLLAHKGWTTDMSTRIFNDQPRQFIVRNPDAPWKSP